VVRVLWIGLGGALGTIARYLTQVGMLRLCGPGFPYGTLTVNIVGSLILGAVMWLASQPGAMSDTVRLTLATGVLGGFTTYSSFNQETLRYLQTGAPLLALLNIAATLLLCLAAGWIGWAGTAFCLGR
jgi:fluoride exporter